jgi:hypothetical protein
MYQNVQIKIFILIIRIEYEIPGQVTETNKYNNGLYEKDTKYPTNSDEINENTNIYTSKLFNELKNYNLQQYSYSNLLVS